MLGFIASAISAVVSIAKVVAPIIGKVVSVAQTVFSTLGVFKPNETVESVGDRAIQADENGIDRSKFENHDEYMEALRDFELDPERSDEISTEEKQVVGVAVGTQGVAEKYDIKIDGETWVCVAKSPDYFTPERIKALVEKGVDMKTVTNYFQDKLGPTQSVNVEKTLMEVDRKIDPELNNGGLYSQLDQVRDAMGK
ncbi:MAG TPA: hypothetical protein ENJ51_09990 [Leucothrix mucor]|uniref:Uncharacterized protein n=1 Tax=Leucothrix mucor TaxID=45248 RepID=A0A7V2T458_LEUMU|nr:hypothetical protein [Leucothrix mucor]